MAITAFTRDLTLVPMSFSLVLGQIENILPTEKLTSMMLLPSMGS